MKTKLFISFLFIIFAFACNHPENEKVEKTRFISSSKEKPFQVTERSTDFDTFPAQVISYRDLQIGDKLSSKAKGELKYKDSTTQEVITVKWQRLKDDTTDIVLLSYSKSGKMFYKIIKNEHFNVQSVN